MSKQKNSSAGLITARTLSGFRDQLPNEALVKENMLETLTKVFRSFGFAPIETPHLEYTEILFPDGGEDIQKEIYRFEDNGGRDVALRFDQTVPLARFIVQHKGKLSLPFKRYVVGNSFRAERPQRGRYREFTQCDFDFIGSTSIVSDTEILQVICASIQSLGIQDFTVSMNNRKVMNAFAEYLQVEDKIDGILRNVDKLDKIGVEKVKGLLIEEVSLSEEQASELMGFISFRESNYDNAQQFFEAVSKYKEYNTTMRESIEELEKIYELLAALKIDKKRYSIDFSIARGLAYYTGLVFETTLDQFPQIGSICSGGRYDNLTKSFSKDNLPGVGASIGLDRLIAALEELKLIQDIHTPAKVLVSNIDAQYLPKIVALCERLREEGIYIELYPDTTKLNKQMKYANNKGFRYVMILGGNEMEANVYTLKEMKTGEQKTELSFEDVISILQS